MVNTSLKNIDFLIQNKDQINDRELEVIYKLSVRYPYSSFCHFFLYSVLKKQNRTGVENVLKKTAIRFHDRSLLKELSENSMVKQNTKERIEVTNIDEIENKEQEKVLNENVYSNIINDNIIQEITETKNQYLKQIYCLNKKNYKLHIIIMPIKEIGQKHIHLLKNNYMIYITKVCRVLNHLNVVSVCVQRH